MIASPPVTASSSDASTTVEARKFRKNGFEQSCEPCRISKLRCDHASPCGRCVRRKIDCVYHPAPMTKTQTESNSRGQIQGSSLSELKRNRRSSYTPPISRKRWKAEDDSPRELDRPMPFSYDTLNPKWSLGYMGSTGASSILLEHEPNIKGFIDTREPRSTESQLDILSATQMKYAADLLSCLPEKSVLDKVLQEHIKWESGPFLRPYKRIISKFHAAFWKTFYKQLERPRSQTKLIEIAEVLSRNTAKPLGIPKTNQEWTESVIGMNSRWELVGILFELCSLHLRVGNATDPIVQALCPGDECPKRYSISLFYCAEACLEQCDLLDEQGNALNIFLRERLFGLQSILEGDTSFCLWRKAGALMSAVVAIGLHQELDVRGPVSLHYAEQRKQLFYIIYGSVVGLACFNGRPAPLSSRYVTITPPLDVDDDILEAGDWERAYDSVDEHGWNKDGKSSDQSLRRIYGIAALLRDEVIELSLSRPTEDTGTQIERLRHKIANAFQSSPPMFRPPFQRSQVDPANSVVTLQMTKAHLMRLQLLFLLERINYAGKPHSEAEAHLDAARETTDIVNLLWMERDPILEDQGRDIIHWFICCYGIQCASALAIDLLRATRGQRPPLDAARRAETIQQLSLFIAALGWIKPEDGNYEMCNRSKRAIKQILDRALDVGSNGTAIDGTNGVAIPLSPQQGISYGSEVEQAVQNPQMNADLGDPDVSTLGIEQADGILSTGAMPNDQTLAGLPSLGEELEGWLESADWMSIPFNFDNVQGVDWMAPNGSANVT